MIVNIEQRSNKLIISYVKKDGNIGFTQLIVPPSQQYSYVYASKKQGIPNLMSWDFKPVRKVPSQFLNKHRIQEFFIDAGEENIKHLFENNMPIFSAADIEVEVTDEGFADPELAQNKIVSICFVKYPDIIAFGSKQLNSDDYKIIENKINNHINNIKHYNFIYKYHSNEADMIYDFLYNYVRNIPLLSGWNFWGYDWRYIFNRCNKLNMDISWVSPTSQWYQYRIKDKNRTAICMLPQHKLIVDYMSIYQKWDRIIEVKENDTLDFVAEEALGIKKVNHSETLKDLYNKNYAEFIFYNAIDTILVDLLNDKLKTLKTFLSLSNITRVEVMSAFSPITMLESTLARYAYKKGMVFPKSDEKRERQPYEGAFVFNPEPDLYEWVASFDFASLYPSIMRQFKLSIENFKFKNKNYIPTQNEIKTSSGAVFDNSYEPLIPKILEDYYTQRKNAKKTYLQAEKECNELEKILLNRINT